METAGRGVPSAHGEDAATRPTVLVADDDSTIRALARVSLVADGWRVVEAATPADCVALAKSERPEIVLLDVTFIGHARDGYAVCRELKSGPETSAIHVVLFTARNDAESRAFASAVGATAFIVKPFGPLDLVRMLRLVRQQPGGEPGIGIFLVEAGAIQPMQLERALAEQSSRGGKPPLGELLVELRLATAEQVEAAAERQRLRTTEAASPRAHAKLRVVVADDNPSVREGLRELFAAEADLTLVGLASDGAEALRLLRDTKPDIAVIDNEMPRASGLEVLRSIRADLPDLRVIMFTLDTEVREAALDAGASAVVTKDTPLATLLNEVRRAKPDAAPVAAPSSVVLHTRSVSAEWRTAAMLKRSLAVIGMLVASHAVAFLLVEPAVGATAAVIGVASVAIGGALLGTEAGLVLGLLIALESAILWALTGHSIGEPILTIGGNGLGVIALMGIGAGFGAMRSLGGHLNPRTRRVHALAEAALAVSGGLDPKALDLLAEAAREIVPGDAALLYVPVPGGGLELVAASGVPPANLGARESSGLMNQIYAQGRSRTLRDLRTTPIPPVPRARSGVVVPIVGGPERSGGVIAVLSTHSHDYTDTDAEALSSYGSFVASLLTLPPAAVAARAEEVAVTVRA